MTKIKPEALNVPEMPKDLEHVWRYFINLKNSGDISYTSIRNFCELMQVDLNPSEISLIMEFDKIYRRVLNG